MDKPKIVLSRCFLEPVRYDGGIIVDEFVDRLKKVCGGGGHLSRGGYGSWHSKG